MTLPWLEPLPVSVPPDLASTVGGHPLVAETLARRGIATPAAARAFLDPDAYTPAPPEALPGLVPAAERLEAAIRAREPICVWGDFDVDGQTSTTLLVSTLRDLGAAVTYHIPVRETEGHGVSLPVLQQAIDAGAQVILTCDTGIAAVEAAELARARGVDMIITDHHDPPPTLPDAYAIINPKVGGWGLGAGGQSSVTDVQRSTFNVQPRSVGGPSSIVHRPSSIVTLPGVGVAYKLAEALYRRAGRPEAADVLLDLVALGIVADLAVLEGDTRYLLQRGLAALRETSRLGLRVLMEHAGLDPARVSEEHIGFVIAPRLNALGRLADANAAVDFLTTTDLTRARILAADLEALNARRKMLCDQVTAAAEAQLARDPDLLALPILVLTGPAWHTGVVGIVASRLVERYGKPTILLSLPRPGSDEPARGSARSVAGVNITAALAAHADLLAGFGGHPMAAGLGLAVERIPELRRALARSVGAMLAEAHAEPGLHIDGILPLADLTLDLAADLERLAPFGPGNPPLTLVSRDLSVRGKRAVGRQDEHLLVIVEDAWGTAQEVIWWDGGSESPPEGKFDLAYTVRSNDYRGVRGIQVTWVAARAEVEVEAEVKAEAEVEVVDYRGVPDPGKVLDDLLAEAEIMIWREGTNDTQFAIRNTHSRTALTPAPCLAIWTAPPGPVELRDVLARVKPQTVYLFGLNPGLDRPDVFLRRLAGLVKHALAAHEGRVELAELAVATASREATVRAGLDWLAARGDVELGGGDATLTPALSLSGKGGPAAGTGGVETGEGRAVDGIVLQPGSGVARPDLPPATARLEALLAETAAYRTYFASADKDRLIRGALGLTG
jgi:single-stranded-DNA-specific exonuclease